MSMNGRPLTVRGLPFQGPVGRWGRKKFKKKGKYPSYKIPNREDPPPGHPPDRSRPGSCRSTYSSPPRHLSLPPAESPSSALAPWPDRLVEAVSGTIQPPKPHPNSPLFVSSTPACVHCPLEQKSNGRTMRCLRSGSRGTTNSGRQSGTDIVAISGGAASRPSKSGSGNGANNTAISAVAASRPSNSGSGSGANNTEKKYNRPVCPMEAYVQANEQVGGADFCDETYGEAFVELYGTERNWRIEPIDARAVHKAGGGKKHGRFFGSDDHAWPRSRRRPSREADGRIEELHQQLQQEREERQQEQE
uniref:Uncharacterized protein n=1 Tax=Oryza glumipatula TaxID=40148 RepID=A0A0E0B469_9ORYZ